MINNLRSMISCTKLVEESSSQILQTKGILKEEVSIEEEQNIGESVLCGRMVVEILKTKIELCPSDENMKIQMTEKLSLLHPTKASYFSRLECTVRHWELQTSENQVFRNDDSTNLPR